MNLFDRNQKQRKFFNERIDTYDDVHSSYMKTKNELADALDNDVKKVLDLGAGTGLELIHLYELYPNVRVKVIDISEEMLNRLKSRDFASNVETVCGDFFEVDFGTDFDAVISTSALHHFKLEEKRILYKKIYDCLKNNGQFINCDKIAESQEIEDQQVYELEHNIENHNHIDTPLTMEHEEEVLNSAGFNEVSFDIVDKDEYRLIKTRKEVV